MRVFRELKFNVGACLAATLVLGCATTGNVKTDFDERADFGKFKTYAFLPPKEIDGAGVLSNSIVRQRVESLISESLDGKGLKKNTDANSADLLVQYWVGIKEKQDVASTPTSPGYYGAYNYGHWAVSYNQYVTYDYREGTLIVDLIDRATKDLAWRAYLVQTLVDSKEENFKTAQKSMQKAFANYPPKKK